MPAADGHTTQPPPRSSRYGWLAIALMFVASFVIFRNARGSRDFISHQDAKRNQLVQDVSAKPSASLGGDVSSNDVITKVDALAPAPYRSNAPVATEAPLAAETTTTITNAPVAAVPATTTAPKSSRKSTQAPNKNNKPVSKSSGPKCLTATPALQGTPFPCATRVPTYNSHAFWAWDDAEKQRRNALLAPIVEQCVNIPPTGQDRPTMFVQLLGCDGGFAGAWSRCWIVAMTNVTASDGTVVSAPTCKLGDHYDVRIESLDAKVAVDRVIDLDNGVYEVQFYIRKRGIYQFAVDKLIMHQAGPTENNILRMTNNANTSVIGMTLTKSISDTFRPIAVTPTPSWPRNVELFTATFTMGVDVVPLPQRCDEVYDYDRFRFGAWFRVGDTCDSVHCVGTGLKERNMEGWLWVSDVCKLNVYNTSELIDLVADTWLVGWGGSTMKQPMSNFVEYYLHKPIFRVFMNQLDSLKKQKKRPGFFSYRQWDIQPFNSTRVSMQWGGCPSLVAGPSGCTDMVGLGNWAKMLALFGNPASLPAAEKGRVPAFPSALMMDMTVWRYPLNDDVVYFKTVDDLFVKVDAWIGNASNRRPPLLVWHTTPSGANSERGTRPAGLPNTFTTTTRNFNWVHEDRVASTLKKRRVVMISRHLMTLPLHFGNDWVHFGLHYGASEGMCNTGHERKGYEFANCVCKTWADDVVLIAWMNAYREHRRYHDRPNNKAPP